MRSCKWWSVSSSALATLLLWASTTNAAVNIDRTRLIFAASDKVQSLNLSNDGDSPMLIQAWTDNGNVNSSPDTSQTPIVVVPPVFRMLPGELRSLRLMLSSRSTLAMDHESQFWLNVYQIPPNTKATQNTARKMVLPLRLRLKVFIRPDGLAAPKESDEQQLRFTVKGQTLNIENPTPWFMSLTVHPGKQKDIGGLMVAPKAWLEVPLSTPLTTGEIMRFDVITDSGNARSYRVMPGGKVEGI
ncbi:fimbrial assembly chaperone [Scandinavium sp. TWS1a]|uniref:fimbrial assembly chaperone n=1 Tax=Scandinavium tedordense TaxID=2926521 RepID=UPI002165FAE6|nr:fimbrial assembly chaperone [Scandinavium tedordense]MCS2170488.1 fimbrial assembly chaperone [Scandinavium tedordense]